jgi:tRNA U55 pseudouridine synthase TruB
MAAPVDAAELMPLVEMLSHMPTLAVGDEMADRVRHGRSLGPSAGSGELAVIDAEGELLAVYESRDGEFRAVKVLVG